MSLNGHLDDIFPLHLHCPEGVGKKSYLASIESLEDSDSGGDGNENVSIINNNITNTTTNNNTNNNINSYNINNHNIIQFNSSDNSSVMNYTNVSS